MIEYDSLAKHVESDGHLTNVFLIDGKEGLEMHMVTKYLREFLIIASKPIRN